MLSIRRSVLLVIDVQGKLARMMSDKYYLRHICCAMKAVHLLEVPIILTEQAPQKIGKTVDEIHAIVPITLMESRPKPDPPPRSPIAIPICPTCSRPLRCPLPVWCGPTILLRLLVGEFSDPV